MEFVWNSYEILGAWIWYEVSLYFIETSYVWSSYEIYTNLYEVHMNFLWISYEIGIKY